MCDCKNSEKKNFKVQDSTSNCSKKEILPSQDIRAIKIIVDGNELFKQCLLPIKNTFLDNALLKNLNNYTNLDKDQEIIINDYCLNDIVNNPIDVSNFPKVKIIFKGVLELLLENTCYSEKVLLNLLIVMNGETKKKILCYYQKFLKNENFKYISKMIVLLNDDNSYKNTGINVEINCDTFIRNNKYLNALYTKVYTDRINITVDNKNYSGTFYDIIIPDYIENFSQVKKLVNLLFQTKEIFKQLII